MRAFWIAPPFSSAALSAYDSAPLAPAPRLEQRRRLALAATLCCLLCTVAADAYAGSVCGTVRDASTLAPVPNAGIFLYQANAYTGLYGATDAGGTYCIADVPAGTYDLQVRVDHHVTTWVRDVEVTSDPTSVDVDAFGGARFEAPWPNPASATVSFAFSSSERSAMTLRVFDARGRFVQGWAGTLDSTDRTLTWNLRDRSGRRTAAGLYFVQLEVRGTTIVRSFVQVR